MSSEFLDEKSKVARRHMIRASFVNQFAPVGSQKENARFYIKAKSKEHALAKIKAHLEGRSHRKIDLQYRGLVKESSDSEDKMHRVHASYHFEGGPEEDVFKTKAKSTAHALNKIGAHLSKHGATKIKLTHRGIEQPDTRPRGEVVSLASKGRYHKDDVKRLLGIVHKPNSSLTKPTVPKTNIIDLAAVRAKLGKN